MENYCIIFSRVSAIGQSYEAQTNELIAEATKCGYTRNQMIVIEGIESAIKLDDEERITLNRLKETIDNCNVDCVFVWEISRISRRPQTLYSIRDFLLKRSIQLIILRPYMKLIEDGKLSTTANILFSLFSSISESEMMLKKERFARAKAKMKADGKLTNGRPVFGYRCNADMTVSIHPVNSRIVQDIYNKYESGCSCGVIAKDLWLSGIFKCQKLNTAKCYVSSILLNKTYLGNNIYPQIISKEQYDKCMKIRNDKTYFQRKTLTKKTYICQGMIYNDNDGVLYSMCPSISNNRYVKFTGNTKSENVSVNMELVDRITTYAVKEYVTTYGSQQSKEDELKMIKQLNEMNNSKLTGIEERIKQANDEIDRINIRIVRGRLNENTGDKMIDNIYKEISKLVDEKDKIISERTSLDNRMIWLTSFLCDENDVPLMNTPEQVQEILHQYCHQIIVHKIKYGTFELRYEWNDSRHSIFTFISYGRYKKLYDEFGKELEDIL